MLSKMFGHRERESAGASPDLQHVVLGTLHTFTIKQQYPRVGDSQLKTSHSTYSPVKTQLVSRACCEKVCVSLISMTHSRGSLPKHTNTCAQHMDITYNNCINYGRLLSGLERARTNRVHT